MIHRLLHLKTNRHSIKLLPHAHTSYSGLSIVLIFFCLAFIFIQHLSVLADSIVVTANVPAPLPTVAPVITYPVNNANIAYSSTVVRGTCQILSPASIIALYRGDTLLGSTICSNAGTFKLSIDLIDGQNMVTPKSFNSLGDAGPVGLPVSLFFTPLTAQNVFSLTSDMPFITYKPNQTFDWNVYIKGGEKPYNLYINWGDNSSQALNKQEDGKVVLSHSYSSTKNYKISVTAIDKLSKERSLEILALTLVSPQSPEVKGSTVELPWINNVPKIYVIFSSLFLALVAFRITPWLVSRGWIKIFDTSFGNHTFTLFLILPFAIVILMLSIFIYHLVSTSL